MINNMALSFKKMNSLNRLLLCRICALNYSMSYSENKAVECEEGPIDEFTSRLMRQKIEKWELRKIKTIDKPFEHSFQPKPLYEKIKNSTYKEDTIKEKCIPCDLNVAFQKSFEDENKTKSFELVEHCIEFKRIPSVSILIRILSFCSQYGEKEMVIKLLRLCEEIKPDILEKYSYFEHYLAEAIWIKGDIVKSLQLFDKVYKENSALRRSIRSMLKDLIRGIITSRSEAALVSTVSFCEKLFANFNDVLPLLYIWQACFLSEWYSDQCIALRLFEENKVLRNKVTGMIPYVTTVSLQNNRIDVLYRLLELLLKDDMKFYCIGVLLALLNYQIHQRDIRSCSEILKWSVDNNINLPTTHHIKLLNLLLGQDRNVLKLSRESTLMQPKTTPHFKF